MGRIFIGLVKVGYSSLRRTRTGVRLVEYMLGNTRVQYLVVWAYSGRNPGILRVSEVPEHQTWLFGVHTQVHTRAPSGCRRYSSTKPGCLGHTRVGTRVPSGCRRYSSTKPGCLGHTRVGTRVPSGCRRYSSAKPGCLGHTRVGTRVPSGCRRYSSTKPGCLGHTRVGIRVPSGCQRYSGIGGTRMPNLVVWIILGEVSGYSQRISY